MMSVSILSGHIQVTQATLGLRTQNGPLIGAWVIRTERGPLKGAHAFPSLAEADFLFFYFEMANHVLVYVFHNYLAETDLSTSMVQVTGFWCI